MNYLESYHHNVKLSTCKVYAGKMNVSSLRTDFWGKMPKNYSLLRMILPLMVLGSSVRNSTIRGYL